MKPLRPFTKPNSSSHLHYRPDRRIVRRYGYKSACGRILFMKHQYGWKPLIGIPMTPSEVQELMTGRWEEIEGPYPTLRAAEDAVVAALSEGLDELIDEAS